MMQAASMLAEMRQERADLMREPICECGVPMIQDAVCRRYNVGRNALLSGRRSARLVLVRHVGIWLSRELTTLTLPAIGRMFRRDHSTIIHAIRRIERLMAADAEFGAEMRALRLALTQPTGEPQ